MYCGIFAVQSWSKRSGQIAKGAFLEVPCKLSRPYASWVMIRWAVAGRAPPALGVRVREAAAEAERICRAAGFRNLDTLIKTLYESYAMGKITEKRFEMLSADYEKEQAELEEVIAADISELEVFTTDKDRAQQFLSIAKRYTDFSQLTTPMINEFVDKILVHAPEKIDGERTIEIEIYLKFIGKFDIPMPEPTPEELTAEEKARKKEKSRKEEKASVCYIKCFL